MRALGMESGAIANSQLSASSEYDVYHSRFRARLHTKETSRYAIGAWSSLLTDLNQWIQVDLGEIKNVTHIGTQGRNAYSPAQYVTRYKLQYSENGTTFWFYKKEGQSSDVVSSFSWSHLVC